MPGGTNPRLAVYMAANHGSHPKYGEMAAALGHELGCRGIALVYGGGNVGLMGVIADAVIAAGGEAIGVIPEALVAKELAHHGCSTLHVVRTMHERKAKMADLSDGFIAMPGGFGTFDEIFEMLTWGQLGYHAKPCGFLNAAGYYDALFDFLDQCADARFITKVHREMILAHQQPEQLLRAMANFKAPDQAKWIDRFDL